MNDDQVRILCVDDEKNVLRALERIFMDEPYEILIAMSGQEGLDVLSDEPGIQVVISDFRMPGMNGVDFLKEVYKRRPDTVRIVLSGYADIAAVVAAINDGRIYKFIPKPWNDDELKVTINNAIERYFLQKRNQQLTEELKVKNEELTLLNEGLENLVAERTEELRFQNRVLDRAWRVLESLPIGVVGLDADGMIVQCNMKAHELLGRDSGEMIGLERAAALPDDINRLVDEVIEKDSAVANVLMSGGEVVSRGVYMRHSDGQEGIILAFVGKEEWR
ncbi:MAG: response regulator [Nitrospirae bacterium]|nr:response regulator [Nitrospirota bacterium]